MKGILLAGGSGSRMYPASAVISKQLLPVYDKPMVYYPFSTLLEADIREILLISTPRDMPLYRNLLGDGGAFGVRLSYAVQAAPRGIAEAFLIGDDFLEDEPAALILGDNLFYGKTLPEKMMEAKRLALQGRAAVFACSVPDPRRFGVLRFGADGRISGIEEKPVCPPSDRAVTGLYFYPAGVSAAAGTLAPSARGELEITSLNLLYLARDSLEVIDLPEDCFWKDAGTPEGLFESAAFIRELTRRGDYAAVPEAIAYRRGWIAARDLDAARRRAGVSPYALAIERAAADH